MVDLTGHYNALEELYESSYFYKPGTAYQQWLVQKTAHHLALDPRSLLADLGCGPGYFTAALRDAAGLEKPPLGIDPIAAFLKQAQARGIDTQIGDIGSFAVSNQKVDRILLKEVIHHIESEDLQEALSHLYDRLNEEGMLLVITRPVEVGYPFFDAAHKGWQIQQPPITLFTKRFEAAGFSVKVAEEEYSIKMSRDRWFTMLRNRFWSHLSAFSDEEMEEGIVELIHQLGDQDPLIFPDRLLFLKATKECL
jgi:SAM-dependent methyltransferase